MSAMPALGGVIPSPPSARGRIDESVVHRISSMLGEPSWMRDWRRRSLDSFHRRPLPTWSGDLSELELGDLSYLPDPVSAPSSSEVNELAQLGVVVLDLRTALRTHEDILRAHWGTVVPAEDNTFAALNGAVWSGGWLVVVPPGVAVDRAVRVPRGRSQVPAGAFERTIVIVGEGASVRLVEDSDDEGTGGPVHAAVTEVIAGPRSRVRHSALQRWGHGVYNLATKRALAAAGASVHWTDVNLGARLTMQYPSVYMRGAGAAGEIITVSIAGDGQHQDAGGKLIFNAPDCVGRILSCVIASRSGRTTFRGLVKVAPGATNAECSVRGESLRLHAESRTDTHPYIEIEEPSARVMRGGMSWTLEEARRAGVASRSLDSNEAVAVLAEEIVAPALAELIPEHASAVLEAVGRLRA